MKVPPRGGHWFMACCLALTYGATAPAAARQAAACTGVPGCRAETESAIAQKDFERAHDLAWRTVQQGPRNDRALMFLLARTQALSNRPDDALVMIRRLAESGAIVDVRAEEFARMACFLCSDAGSFVTGVAINVDGGASPVV